MILIKQSGKENWKMKIRERYCEVCNHTLNISKDNVYTANVGESIFGMNEKWDAIDCPYCGCQNLLKRRYAKNNKQVNV